MLLIEAINAFVEDVAGWKRNETPKSYRAKLRRLLEEFPHRSLKTISLDDLNKLKRGMMGRCSPYTVKSVLTTIKHFFKWASENGLIKQDPALKLKIPLPPPPDPKAVAPETVEALIETASAHGEAWETTRNVAILYWLRDTGGRACGLISARLSGLDLRRGRCTVVEKDRPRVLYLNTPTITAIKLWLREREFLDPLTDHLFISYNTRAGLSRSGLTNILRTLKNDAGIKSRCNPHSFRHAFARDCLRNHADLSQVSQLLGHSTITVTAAYYARWADHELKRVHHLVSPGRKLKVPG